jgi:diguanylate cyclase (GGDEF)-like protein/PAS domain S-box-containing protein
MIATCLFLPVTAMSNDTLTLQLRWLHQAQFAGYYMAKEKGFYAQAGLDVNIVAADPGSLSPLEQVLSGEAQFGVGNAGLVAAYLEGRPVVALAALFQRSPNVWLTRADSGIYTLSDLAQSRLMMTKSVENAELLAMFHKEGVNINKLNIQSSTFNLQDLITQKTDAFNGYITNEPFALQEQDVAYRIFDPQSYGVDFYSDILFTSQDFLKQNPKQVEAFREASLTGWLYALNHLEETSEVIQQHYNTQNKSAQHIAYELASVRQIVIPDLIQIGHMNPSRWQNIATSFRNLNLITAEPKNLTAFIYDPHPEVDLKGYYWTIIILLIALSLTVLMMLTLRHLNAQLRQQMSATQTARQQYQYERDQLNAILANIADGVITLDTTKTIRQVNHAATLLLGVAEQALKGKTFAHLNFYAIDSKKPLLIAAEKEDGTIIQGDVGYQHPAGEQRIIHYSCAPIQSKQQEIEGYVLTLQDITDNYLALSEANKQAQHDHLTGLPNRLLLQERLHQQIVFAIRHHTQVGVIFLDLDGFKPINDRHGHAAGDNMLIHIAKTLSHLTRESDTVARLGGDEFVIVASCLSSNNAITQLDHLSKRILEEINTPIMLDNINDPIHVGVSLGIAVFPQDGHDPDILLRQADMAMYKAKQDGRNCWCFAQTIHDV